MPLSSRTSATASFSFGPGGRNTRLAVSDTVRQRLHGLRNPRPTIDTAPLHCYSTLMFGYPHKHVRFAAAGQALSLVGDVA